MKKTAALGSAGALLAMAAAMEGLAETEVAGYELKNTYQPEYYPNWNPGISPKDYGMFVKKRRGKRKGFMN